MSSFPEPTQWTGDESDPFSGSRRCDACDEDCGSRPVALPFGTYCSYACADAEEAKFQERMRRRCFQTVDHQLDPLEENPFE